MKRMISSMLAVGALTLAAAPAMAQPFGDVNGWQSINGRQARLDARIDQGVRDGSLTRNEAIRLRGEFRAIADLETRYRASNGLDPRERADLDRRFDALSGRIRVERADNQVRGPGRDNGGWNINARQAQLDRRIDLGVRNGSLTRAEAGQLRGEFRDLTVLEARYRSTAGLDNRERADLERRFDRLEARLRVNLADRDFRWDDGYRYR